MNGQPEIIPLTINFLTPSCEKKLHACCSLGGKTNSWRFNFFVIPPLSRFGYLGLLPVPQFENMDGWKEVLFKREFNCGNECLFGEKYFLFVLYLLQQQSMLVAAIFIKSSFYVLITKMNSSQISSVYDFMHETAMFYLTPHVAFEVDFCEPS